ncbi:uncharacterized protein LAJ45_07483 [Morchella importuna]|uniref:uncharacterized protein n=1 Tax=Morchella importuna TaxID=1174673 RepID=UPI001E8E553F|nr:uncharacterized protein LAJ45_07483 [Morchella importuna]KAH8148382.1 hypothetical protein LAJ45_07483 [Morchella importuna]
MLRVHSRQFVSIFVLLMYDLRVDYLCCVAHRSLRSLMGFDIRWSQLRNDNSTGQYDSIEATEGRMNKCV